MKEIDISIENGYGILKFDHKFIFDGKSNFYGLYAQNGTMKSSFAKVLLDYSKGESVRDKLFNEPGRCTVSGIDTADILSFPCFDGGVEFSEEAEKLVANEAAKKAYDEALKDTQIAFDAFTEKLIEVTQSTGEDAHNIINNLYRAFISEGAVETITLPSVVQLLKANKPEIDKGNVLFADIAYKRFIHSNFMKFVENKKYTGFFADLAKAYDEFRQSPTYYRNGFDASSATKLIKELKDSKYFEANHAVTLKHSDGTSGSSIQTSKELESELKTDLDRIIEKNPKLEKPLNDLIKEFSIGTNGDVRNIFEDNTKRQLLLLMGNKERFYKSMWYGYLLACKNEVSELIEIHGQASETIKKALENAASAISEWEEVKDIFNDRFRNLPYEIHITNKPDAIVSDLIKPVFEIRFENPRKTNAPYKERPDSYNKLQALSSVLSNGERKALYLLNVIFRLHNQIKEDRETLVVLDDIVESFDYKNKYAFFEYLNDLSSDENKLYIIVLTHNFDFYRLIYEKIQPHNGHQFKLILKTKSNELSAEDMFNPRIFSDIKNKASSGDGLAWISLIPLARNLAEYSHGSSHEDYLQLTRCLHVMPDSLDINTLVPIIRIYTGIITTPHAGLDAVHDTIVSAADLIESESDESFDLYKNFVLAMSIRILIERYIISKLTNQQYLDVVAKARDQTRLLIKVYFNNSPDPRKAITMKQFKKALMIIDGSIHINSFMYEPLVDMGTWELKEMYRDIVKVVTP